jgi:hypothetical protein
MNNVKHDTKIGMALTESELEDIITCVDEVQQRMDTSRDKGWGTKFNVLIINRLKGLLNDLISVQDKNNSGETAYEELPKENCEVCE